MENKKCGNCSYYVEECEGCYGNDTKEAMIISKNDEACYLFVEKKKD